MEVFGYSRWSCHKGSLKVFSHDSINVFGGGKMRDLTTKGMDVIIACGVSAPQDIFIRGFPTGWFKLKSSKVIELDWTDGGIPSLDKGDWDELWNGLQRLQRKEEREINVLCCCQGGHGRTGTALAILAGVSGAYQLDPAKDILKWVRERYCSEAVERFVQVKYIEECTGYKLNYVEPKPAITYGSWDWIKNRYKEEQLYGD